MAGKYSHLNRHPFTGFTLVEIMIVVAIIGIILVIAVPGWLRHRTVSQARVCQENLRIIDGAKESMAMVEGLAEGATVTWSQLVSPSADRSLGYLDRGQPFCPAGGEYRINPIGVFPECSLGSVVFLEGNDAAQHRITGFSSGS